MVLGGEPSISVPPLEKHFGKMFSVTVTFEPMTAIMLSVLCGFCIE